MAGKTQIACLFIALSLAGAALAQDEAKCAKLSSADRDWQQHLEYCITDPHSQYLTKGTLWAKSGDYQSAYNEALACLRHNTGATNGVKYCAGPIATGTYLAGTMSHEERVVRRTYATLSFAVQFGALLDSGLMSQASRKNAETSIPPPGDLTFELKDLKIGRLEEISDRYYGDLVAKPTGGEVVGISKISSNFSWADQEEVVVVSTAQAYWTTSQDMSRQNWNIPLGEAIRLTESGARYSRYATYTATAKFAGHSRTYRALFLFGWDDEADTEIVSAADLVTGNGVLSEFVDGSYYPEALLNSRLRSNPKLKEWIHDHPIEGCKPGTKNLCCDLKTLTCGIPAEDIQASVQPVVE